MQRACTYSLKLVVVSAVLAGVANLVVTDWLYRQNFSAPQTRTAAWK